MSFSLICTFTLTSLKRKSFSRSRCRFSAKTLVVNSCSQEYHLCSSFFLFLRSQKYQQYYEIQSSGVAIEKSEDKKLNVSSTQQFVGNMLLEPRY
jgi:hypothetical protein